MPAWTTCEPVSGQQGEREHQDARELCHLPLTSQSFSEQTPYSPCLSHYEQDGQWSARPASPACQLGSTPWVWEQ